MPAHQLLPPSLNSEPRDAPAGRWRRSRSRTVWFSVSELLFLEKALWYVVSEKLGERSIQLAVLVRVVL